jgi:copper homeostasis protein
VGINEQEDRGLPLQQQPVRAVIVPMGAMGEGRMLLEVIAINLDDVKTAVQCGVDRIELVTGIGEGGLTPSLGLIERAVEAASIPIHVMLRPHSQSFVYSEEDQEVLLRDLLHIGRIGPAGIVFGALTENGQIDTRLLELVLNEARQMNVTFHRAFDEVEDQASSLKTISRYPQVNRILTSGGRRPAPESIPAIKQLTRAADERGITLLAGHGLKPQSILEFVEATGVREVHFGSAVRKEQSFRHPLDPQCLQNLRRCLDILMHK